jgi:hypothetical protein
MPFLVGATAAAVSRPEHSGWKSVPVAVVPPVPIATGAVVPPVPLVAGVTPPVLVGGVVVTAVVPPVLMTPPVPPVVEGELSPPHPWTIKTCARSATVPT